MIERPAVRPAFLGDPAADPALELRRDADAFDDAPTEDRTVARRSRVERELDARRAGVHHQDGIGFRHRLLSSPRRFGLQRGRAGRPYHIPWRSEEHTSELQSLMRISYAVFCLKKKRNKNTNTR